MQQDSDGLLPLISTPWKHKIVDRLVHKLTLTYNKTPAQTHTDTAKTTCVSDNISQSLTMHTIISTIHQYYHAYHDPHSTQDTSIDCIDLPLLSEVKDVSAKHSLLLPRPYLLVGRVLLDRTPDASTFAASLLLSDATASLTIHLIHADVTMYGRLVMLCSCQLIYNGTTGSVEADAKDAVILPEMNSHSPTEDTKTASLFQFPPTPLYRLNTLQVAKLLVSSSSRSVSRDRDKKRKSRSIDHQPHQQPPVHVRGRITALSPIIIREKTPFFFVEITDEGEIPSSAQHNNNHAASLSGSTTGSVSTMILFHSLDAVHWYHFLHMNAVYLFANLKRGAVPLAGKAHPILVCRPINTAPPTQTAALPSALPGTALFPLHSLSPFHHMNHPQTLVFSATAFTLPPYTDVPNNLLKYREELSAGRSSSVSVSPSLSVGTCVPSSPGRCNGMWEDDREYECTAVADSRHLHTVTFMGVIVRPLALYVYELEDTHHATTSSSFTPTSHSASYDTVLSARRRPVLRLYLTHYQSAAAEQGVVLRAGCTVLLHHVHPIFHSTRFLGLGCCAHSHVEILMPSPFSRTHPSYHRTQYPIHWTYYQQFNLADTALLIDLWLELRRKWGKHISQQLLGGNKLKQQPNNAHSQSSPVGITEPSILLRVLSDWVCSDYEAEIYQQFLQHDTCTITVSRSPCPTGCCYPFFPSLFFLLKHPQLLSSMHQLQQQMRRTRHLSSMCHFCIVPSSAFCAPGLFITGYLRSTVHGYYARDYNIAGSSSTTDDVTGLVKLTSVQTGLRLTDTSAESTGLDCVVVGDLSPDHLDVLYHIRAFHLVIESMSAPSSSHISSLVPTAAVFTSAPSAYAHLVIYLVFNVENAVPLTKRATMAPPSASPVAGSGSSSSSSPLVDLELRLTHKSLHLPLSSPVARAMSPPPTSLLRATTLSASTSTTRSALVCQLEGVSTQGNQPEGTVLVELDQSLSVLYPLLSLSSVFTISHCQLLPPHLFPTPSIRIGYRVTENTQIDVQRQPSSNARQQSSIRQVAELLSCDVESILAAEDNPMAVEWVSLTGLVLDKQFRIEELDDTQASRTGTARTSSMPSSLLSSLSTINAAPLITGKWYLKLRDLHQAHTIDVYVPFSQCMFPAGVVLGSTVRIDRVRRKVNATWRLYLDGHTNTLITILSFPSASPTTPSLTIMPDNKQLYMHLPTTFLSSLSVQLGWIDQRILRLRARLIEVKKLSFKFLCRVCGQIQNKHDNKGAIVSVSMNNTTCAEHGCMHLYIQCQGSMEWHDGTAMCLLFLDEAEFVWNALHLTPYQIAQIQHWITDYGELDYEASKHAQLSSTSNSNSSSSSSGIVTSEDVDLPAEQKDPMSRTGKNGLDAPLSSDAQRKRKRLFEYFSTHGRARECVVYAVPLIHNKMIQYYEQQRKEWRASGKGANCIKMRIDTPVLRYTLNLGGDAYEQTRPQIINLRGLHCEPVCSSSESLRILQEMHAFKKSKATTTSQRMTLN